jgi:hypothetical protein
MEWLKEADSQSLAGGPAGPGRRNVALNLKAEGMRLAAVGQTDTLNARGGCGKTCHGGRAVKKRESPGFSRGECQGYDRLRSKKAVVTRLENSLAFFRSEQGEQEQLAFCARMELRAGKPAE